jgi:protein disulfide-isomerase A6
MKPAFDKLAAEYEASSSVVIADVDCTKEQDLCGKHGVKGYPTIKYWQDGEVKDYQGARDFDGLKKFVTDTLEKKCFIADQASCSEKEKKFIGTRQAKDKEANTKELARLTKMAGGSSMKAELKQWLHQRLNILKQL